MSVSLTPQQVALAAAAGQRLLQLKDLPVPLELAKSGALGALEAVLGGIITGELILSQAPVPHPDVGEEPTPEGPKLVTDETESPKAS